jgi:uncharacterized protein YfaS (alpha-2-macroglobulin family)
MEAANDGKPINASLTFNGEQKTLNLTGAQLVQQLGNVPSGGTDFTLVNNSEAPLYARVSSRGIPAEGGEPALSNGLSLEASYTDSGGAPVDPDAAPLGSDIKVTLKVTNTAGERLDNIALSAPLPASWEIANNRLSGQGGATTGLDYQDIRDDRVLSYFSLGAGKTLSVTFWVNKTYDGAYYRPAIRAYAMYDESITAVLPGVKAGE